MNLLDYLQEMSIRQGLTNRRRKPINAGSGSGMLNQPLPEMKKAKPGQTTLASLLMRLFGGG